MAQELVVLSPEKTVLTYRLASLGSRAMAHALDLIVVGVVLLATLLLLARLGVMALAPPLLPLTVFLYFILLEGLWNGKTVGKWALRLKVAMSDGRPVTFAAALGRNLLRPADMVPGTYFVGLLAMFTNPKSQRLGDLAAQTVVISVHQSEPRFSPAPHVLGEHPLERYVGDLRGMTREEYVALRRLCDRFPYLPASVQSRLIRDVWRPIALRRHVPSLPNVHDIYLAEAVVMRYGRAQGML